MVTSKRGIEFNIDDIATDLNGKMDKDGLNATCPMVVETYKNGTDWYRVWSDGWCEQGGNYTISTSGSGTITFHKAFVDTNYSVFCNKTSSDSSSWNVMFSNRPNWTTTSVTIKANLTGYALGGSWEAKGYIS